MARLYDIGRYEYKYAVPIAWRDRILAELGDEAVPDPHASELPFGGRGYAVHSLYLDTPELSDYWDRLGERRVRNRLRVRTYGAPGDGAPVFLENKRKLEQWVVKSRCRLPATADDWCASGLDRPWDLWIDQVRGRQRYGALHFRRLVDGEGRHPVSVVHYLREVFVGTDPDQPKVRLTMDREVTATVAPRATGLYDPPDIYLLPPDWMVLELKFDGDRPPFMRRIARKLRLRATPVSKFGLSVALGVAGAVPRQVRYLTPHPLRRAGLLAGSASRPGARA